MSDATCSSCGAPILWVTLAPKTGKPKPHPLDHDPTGKAIVRFGPDGAQARIVDTYVSHFSTCVHAAQHRRKKTP